MSYKWDYSESLEEKDNTGVNTKVNTALNT